MKRGVFLSGVAAFSLLLGGHTSFCQESSPSSSRHLIIRFRDPGPPAIHSVQARTSDKPHGVWCTIPANISLSEDGFHYKATLEMPDARWGMFRVKRLGSGDSPPLTVSGVEAKEGDGAIFPVDVSYPSLVKNEELMGERRFEGLIPGVDFAPGKVIVGFWQSVSEEEVVALFEAGGLPFESYFPRIFHVSCLVTSGEVPDHIETLMASGIVLRAERTYRYGADVLAITVTFNVRATPAMAEELFESIEGLEPDWSTFLQAEKFGVVYVPEGHEFAWIVALEHAPFSRYAELSYINYRW